MLKSLKMSGDTMFMDNLDEFVNDENRIVTYKWLSQTLQVHVNQAKQMLYAFVEDQRNKKDNDSLHVTYFVAGTVKSPTMDVGGIKCTVVPEEELETVKSSLEQVSSCHIFSVQKAKLKDSSPLYITDYSALKENIFETNKFSAINFKKAKIRSREELDRMAEKPATKMESVTSTAKTIAASSNTSSKQTGKGGSKGGIASMFASAGTSKKEEASKPEAATDTAAAAKETAKPQSGATGSKSKKAAGSGSVMSFFSNHTGKANKTAEKPSPPAVVEKKPAESSAASAKPKSAVSKTTEKKKPPRVHSVSDSDEDSKPQKKKRRRIQAISDSSSEEEMEIEDSPVPSPQSPPVLEPEESVATETKEETKEEDDDEDVIPSTPQNGVKHKHVRRRKRVQKTYMDEDGFMVTENVMESESASEVDDDPKPSKEATLQPAAQKAHQSAPKKDAPAKKASPQKKKTPPPSKGNQKQMSLTSFFTKKQ